MKKNFLALAVLAVIAVAATVTDANAVCSVQKLFGTFDNDSATFTYVITNPASTNATIVGHFWQAGGFALGNDGTYDDSQWLKVYPGSPAGQWYVSGAMASLGVVGCPAGRLIITFADGAQQAMVNVNETPAASLWWNMTRTGGNITLVNGSRVKLSNRQVSGNTRTFDLSTDAAAGFYGDSGSTNPLTSYRIMQQRKPTGQAAPGNAVSGGWTEVGSVAPGGTLTGFTIDCTTQDQVYLAVRNQYDGGQSNADNVGPITRVSCDPTLADPESPNFKVIKKTAKVPAGKPSIQ